MMDGMGISIFPLQESQMKLIFTARVQAQFAISESSIGTCGGGRQTCPFDKRSGSQGHKSRSRSKVSPE
jgi:hypothetical protein